MYWGKGYTYISTGEKTLEFFQIDRNQVRGGGDPPEDLNHRKGNLKKGNVYVELSIWNSSETDWDLNIRV